MNIIEALMAADEKAITAPNTKEYEVKRLSKALKTPFILQLTQIPAKRYSEIQNISVKTDSNGRYEGVDLYTMNMLSLTEGISTKLGDKELLKKYGCGTVKDLYGKLFNAGEITAIAAEIGKLCGFNAEDKKGKVDEVKN